MEYPKMLYRGKRHSDWQAFGAAVHAKQVDTAIAANDEEEIQLRVDGYGDVDIMIGEAPAAAAEEPVEQLQEPLEQPASETPPLIPDDQDDPLA